MRVEKPGSPGARVVEGSDAEELLTPGEAAALVKLTVGTLKDKRWKGTGPRFIKLSPGRGGRIRYRRGDVQDWVAARGRVGT
ncbi:helix-turn-helix domain-containing protein [Streptomyces hokutonensis]|uniref:helix-turn-helix domain-containing protein n=1 Tax=Streptomyces hokutonensis TaxID=1306990 RepID=UPI0007C57961|nr:helix-turn-helix domain-containing protein [Streptomyces hokutonensis]